MKKEQGTKSQDKSSSDCGYWLNINLQIFIYRTQLL